MWFILNLDPLQHFKVKTAGHTTSSICLNSEFLEFKSVIVCIT